MECRRSLPLSSENNKNLRFSLVMETIWTPATREATGARRVAFYGGLNPETLRSILRQAKISFDELSDAL